jgi:hypothetical protein
MDVVWTRLWHFCFVWINGLCFLYPDALLFILFSCVAKLTRVRVFAWFNLLCFLGSVANQRFSECKARTVIMTASMVILVFMGTHLDMGSAFGIPDIL